MIEHPAIPRPRRPRATHQHPEAPLPRISATLPERHLEAPQQRPQVPPPRERTSWWNLLREVLVLGLLLVLYRSGRALADGRHLLARQHAHSVRLLEAHLHLPDEVHLQHLLLTHPHLAHAADAYYATVHFPLTGAVLLWLFLRPSPSGRELYRRTRNTLVAATSAGLLLAFAYPLAPPRMMGELGFTDVAARFGQSVYQGAAATTSNQFAAMPSLHVGWAVLVALALFHATPSTTRRGRWLRWAWWAHPVITLFVVISTGNHFWVDALVGTALILSTWAVTHSRHTQHTRSATSAPSTSTSPHRVGTHHG